MRITGRFSTLCALAFAAACTGPGPDFKQGTPLAREGFVDLSDWNFEADGSVHLRGDWEFYWRRLLTPADFSGPGAIRPDAWFPVPLTWNRHSLNGEPLSGHGFATKRLRVALPPTGEFSIRFLDAGTSYRLFANGRVIATNGEVGPDAASSRPQFRALIASLPLAAGAESDAVPAANAEANAGRAKREVEFVIQIANFTHRRGGMWVPIELGTPEFIQTAREEAMALEVFIFGAMFIIGLYHLAYFAIRRRYRSSAFFGILCLTLGLRALLHGERFLMQIFPGLPFEALLKLDYLTLALAVPFFASYLRNVFPEEMPLPALRIIQTVAGVFTALIVLTSVSTYSHTLPLYQIFILITIIFTTVIATRALIHRRDGSRLFWASGMIPLFTTLNDVAFQNYLSPVGNLTPFGMIAFVLAQAIFLARRYAGAFVQVERLSGELENQNKELVRLDELKDEFLSNTSHELRTPLQGIIGIAESLRDESDLPPTARRRADLILASGQRLAGLVNDILDFEKLKHHDVSLSQNSIDLRSLVQVQIELLAFNVKARRTLAFFNDVPADLPPVLGDEDRITQVLQNLLGNAIKYTDSGEIRVAGSRLPGDMVRISVSDSGRGIAPEDRETIFQPFVQSSVNRGGTGLGLTIARSLVRLQKGDLWLDESFTGGSRFIFTLPARKHMGKQSPSTRADQTGLPFGQAPPNRSGISSLLPEIEPPALAGRSEIPDDAYVLVVDDEPVNLEIMSSYLGAGGLSSVPVTNTDEARAILNGSRLPECVLLDIMMPGVSGLDFARELRQRFSLTELPILMITARTNTKDLVAAMAAGANDYLTKPFQREEFLFRVKSLVTMVRGGHEAAREAAQQERQRINVNLHDHLGASLTDLQLLIESARKSSEVAPEFTDRLERLVTEAIRMLRTNLLALEDLTLLEENFLDGAHIFMLRRYVDAGREIDFRAQVANRNVNHLKLDPGRVSMLYSVLNEMITNDLKYGAGMAILEFNWDNRELLIDFQSNSRYRLESHGSGRGTANMIRRLAEFGGTFHLAFAPEEPEHGGDSDVITGQRIQVQIRVPLRHE